MIRCRLLGHRYRFAAEGRSLVWTCVRGCGASESKHCPTAEQASRYAAAFDREDSAALGTRAPLVGLLPLRLARLARRLLGR